MAERVRRLIGCAAALLLAGAHSGWAGAASGHESHAAAPPAAAAPVLDLTLYDVELVNQDDEAVMFVSDVVGDSIVVMDFIYTTCTTVCPVQTALLVALQDKLGARVGDDVHLVSLSVDPTTDTPARLRAFAAKHGSGPGWTWLTGQKRALDKVLTGLGAYTEDYTQHPAMVLIGDGRSGEWRRFYGFPSPDQLAAAVEELTTLRRRAMAGSGPMKH